MKKVREIARILTDNGFECVRRRGSHRQFTGFVNGKRRSVTLAGNDGDDVSKTILSSIRRQSGLPRQSFR